MEISRLAWVPFVLAAGLVWFSATVVLATTPAGELRNIVAHQGDGETILSLETDGPVSNLTQFRVADPNRLVIDLDGMKSALGSNRIAVGSSQVERVRIGVYPEKLRLVIDPADTRAELKRARILHEPNGLRIVVSLGSEASDQGSVATAPGSAIDELREAARSLALAARELRAAAGELAAAETVRPPAPPVAPAVEPTPPRAQPKPVAREREPAPTQTARRAPSGSDAREPRPALRSTPAPEGAGEFHQLMAWVDANRDARPRFAPNETLDQNDLGRLEDVVPPRYLAEFQFPELELEIQPTAHYRPHPLYEAATLQWSGQVQLAEDRSLANFVAGLPFPEARIAGANRQDAAYMVAWNRVYRWQHYGYRTRPSHQAYLSPGPRAGREGVLEQVLVGGGTVERHLVSKYHRVYLSHLATHADEGFALKLPDAKRLRYKDYLTYTDPFELRGSSFVIERAIDPSERDQVNSYLPTERRVRRLSPKERADSFLGSEFTLDDFEGFSGRVLDYEWVFHGEKRVMGIVDARGPHLVFHGPESRIPKDRWQLRDCYVVEQRPTLEGHPYGRKLLFFDKETYGIPLGLFFDREDRLLKIVLTTYKRPEREGAPDPRPADTVGHWLGGFAINVQTGVSTAVWSGGTDIPDVTASQVRRLFSVANLTEGR